MRLAVLPVLFAAALLGQTGPAVGTKAPNFEAADQNGVRHSLQSLMGPKGMMLVFFRSADW
jgi:peroxiredoxin